MVNSVFVADNAMELLSKLQSRFLVALKFEFFVRKLLK